MKHIPDHGKSTQQSTAKSLHGPTTGPRGMAIAPPAYGIGFVDQQESTDEEAMIQRRADVGGHTPMQQQENRTGLPDRLKAGVEVLSGLTMDDVRVHYNSGNPEQFEALAYTQGTNIYVSPGQEQHLPHEAWHVVQQKQGRVKPAFWLRGEPINDDQSLEHEAEMLGYEALRISRFDQVPIDASRDRVSSVMQRNYTAEGLEYRGKTDRALQDKQLSLLSSQAVTTFKFPFVIQKRTKIIYGPPRQFQYNNPALGGGLNSYALVGNGVFAELDLNDPVSGSHVGTGVPAAAMNDLTIIHPNISWVQGHLLNSNLGGIGYCPNLAPITQEANFRHTWDVEQPVKRLLYNQNNAAYALANDGYVQYQVQTVSPLGAPPWSSIDPDIYFDCSWRYQLPQNHPVGGPQWSAWSLHRVESRIWQTEPPVPQAWQPFGTGFGPINQAGNNNITNVSAYDIVNGNAQPNILNAIGGPPAWNPPAGAVGFLVQQVGGNYRIIGWQF